MSEQKSAASRYREILDRRREAESTYKAVSPSGMEWELRRISVQTFVLAGKLPVALAEKMAEAERLGQGAEVFEALPDKEKFDAMKFLQFLVKEICVNPRIVKEAVSEDEVDFVLEEDFAFLVREAMGGDESRRLETFRAGHGQNALGGAGGAKLREKGKRTARNKK